MENLQGAFYLLLHGHMMSIMVLLLGNLSNSVSQLTSRNKQEKVPDRSYILDLSDSHNFVHLNMFWRKGP